MTHEQMAKAKACKSAEELIALAKENGLALTAAEAEEKYSALHPEGELSDDELDGAAGGGCGGGAEGSRDYVKVGETVRGLNDLVRCVHCWGDTFVVNEAGAYVYTVTCTACGVRQATGDGLGNPEADNGKYYERIE